MNRHNQLTLKDVARIRELYAGGTPVAELSVMFLKARETIRRIIRRETWDSLPPAPAAPNDLLSTEAEASLKGLMEELEKEQLK